jgi:hypothetical protein
LAMVAGSQKRSREDDDQARLLLNVNKKANLFFSSSKVLSNCEVRKKGPLDE